MRITQNILHMGALARHQQNLKQIVAAEQRVATGLRVGRASDDPAGASQIMQAGSSLRALEQYHRNIQSSRARVDAEERTLDQLGEVLVRAKEIALAHGGDNSNAAARRSGQAEIQQLLHFAVQLANTQIAGSHLFGGAHANVPPVAWPDPENAPPEIILDPLEPGHHRAEISAGSFIQTASNAQEVFGATGVFQALWALSEALGSDDAAAVRESIPELDRGFGHVQALIGDVGARATQLQVTAANLDALDINLRTLKADIEEVDFERAVTELVTRQTTFQAAMLAASRVMGMTLADYLR